MVVSDPIADFLTRIRNALKAEHRFVDIRWSKLKQSLADILKNQGFVESYLIKKDSENRGTIRVFLKYKMGRTPVITGIKRISKPGRRQYVQHQDIPQFFGGLGLSILSTSLGVMSGKDANDKKVGGELLCLVW